MIFFFFFFFFFSPFHAFQRVVFAACDPKSFDLPGNYRWIAPSTLAGEICFRYQMTSYELPGRPDHALFVYNTLYAHYEYGCHIMSASIMCSSCP